MTAAEAERNSREAESRGALAEAAMWAARAAEEHARLGGFLIAVMWCKTAIRLDASLLAVWTEFERTVGREEWTPRHVLSVAADALEKAGRTELAAAMRQRLD